MCKPKQVLVDTSLYASPELAFFLSSIFSTNAVWGLFVISNRHCAMDDISNGMEAEQHWLGVWHVRLTSSQLRAFVL